MKRVLLFGANGNVGKEIARELAKRRYDLTAVVRSEDKALSLSAITQKYIIADVSDNASIKNICTNQEIVISALGKSVSPNDKSKSTFHEVDYHCNANILEAAITSNVQKFVYISAFQAEKYQSLDYFKAHHNFSELLKNSGIDYSIIKPPAVFSAFLDMLEMAKKGRLFIIGKGEKKTNPIFEGDIARVAVDSIDLPHSIIEAGGKKVYTRRQLSEIIQREVDPNKKIKTFPLGFFKALLPLIKIFDRSMYDKFAFFSEVIQHDLIAPKIGDITFENYITAKVKYQDQTGN